MKAGWMLMATMACAPALAQVPQVPVNPSGATTTIDQDKSAITNQQATPRPTSTRPGVAPPPMNIRIKDEGVKMPSCTAESREGESCKK